MQWTRNRKINRNCHSNTHPWIRRALQPLPCSPPWRNGNISKRKTETWPTDWNSSSWASSHVHSVVSTATSTQPVWRGGKCMKLSGLTRIAPTGPSTLFSAKSHNTLHSGPRKRGKMWDLLTEGGGPGKHSYSASSSSIPWNVSGSSWGRGSVLIAPSTHE